MFDFTDRLPTAPNRKKITPEGGSAYYATVEFADSPTENGTPLTRNAMMALQGMEDGETVFNSDGSITETFSTGTVTTTFNSDGSITETFVSSVTGATISKTTTFNSDGSITESVS